jgi:tetratricopeptide (TPR) repeat protein
MLATARKLPQTQEARGMSTTPHPPLWNRIRARLWYAWGLSLCYNGNRLHDRSYYTAGVDSFGRATRAWPEYAPAYYRRGLIRGRELGDYRGAIVDLTRACALRPTWPDPYLQRGLFHRFHGNPQAARDDLTHYVELAEAGYWRDEAARQIGLIQAEIDG